MKFSCTKDNLLLGLSATAHIAGRNINLPILNNTLLVADKKGIRLTATNLELAVVSQVRGKVDEDGEFTLPSKLLFDYINLLPNERVDVEKDENTLRIHCENNETQIQGLPSGEFPLVPPVVGDHVVELDAAEFRNALSQVLFSVAANESRAELSGVSFRFGTDANKKPILTLAATDSYRLSERTVVLDSAPSNEHGDVIIPARTLSEASRILGLFRDDPEADRRLQIRLSDAQAVLTYNSVELTSRTIQGSYPDYRQIIPTTFRTEAVARREDLMKAVKTASLFSRTGLYDVTLSIDPTSGITASANDSARGKNTARTDAVVTGEPNKITVNSRYLLDGLGAIDTDEVTFGVNDGANPCLLRPKGKEGYLYLVMPIKQ